MAGRAAHSGDSGKGRSNPVVFLSGEQVYLRPLEMTDVPRCTRWINDPRTRRTLLHNDPMNEQAERGWIEHISSDRCTRSFAIVRRNNDRHIGNCSLSGINWRIRYAAFGILIGEVDERGKGLGTEVTRMMVRYGFETLNLNRIELGVYDVNPYAAQAYESAGFSREGIFRQRGYVDGQYVDEVRYAILAADYFAASSAQATRTRRRRR